MIMDFKYNDKLTEAQRAHINNLGVTKIKPKKVRKPNTGNRYNNPHNLDPQPGLLTIREVADMLRVGPLTLKRWEVKGHIKSIRINSRGDRRYTRDEIDRILGGTK